LSKRLKKILELLDIAMQGVHFEPKKIKFIMLIIFWNDQSTMPISKYPLLAQDKSWEKKKEKKVDWYGWWGIVAFAKSAN